MLSGVPEREEPARGQEKSAPGGGEAQDPTSGPLLLQPGAQPEAAAYQRPAGVVVDARYLGGKTYSEVREVLSEQLGALLSATDMPGDGGRELVFERGKLRVVDDRIFRIYVPIEPALRRTAALEAVGFPPASGRYITLHREYRLNHEWGFRRVRLMRENRRSELVNAVDAWYKVPGEASGPH